MVRMSLDEPPLASPPPRHGTEAPSGLCTLDDEEALDPQIAGGKGAALARVHRAGFETLPAAVITTSWSDRFDRGLEDDRRDLDRLLHQVLDHLGPSQTMIVRSSSVVEDGSASSKAGQFESVLGVTGLGALKEAVEIVYRSRQRAGASDEPMAVLVQPMVEPSVAGVYFGIDPVSGRADRRVVAAVRGGPDQLVSGQVDGSRWLLDATGRVLDAHVDEAHLGTATMRSLVRLGDGLAAVFDGPQDIEWGLVDGRLIVFQSRPITSEVRGVPSGPVYGPGPVAETFPEALTRLETDLWVDPLRDGVREALRISGAVAQRDLRNRALVIDVDGQVAIDLEITGELGRRRGLVEGMRARVRRLRSAWRIGRLRVALPALAHDLCERADDDLEQLPPFDQLATRQLVALIGRGRLALRSLHAHEILMGLVSGSDPPAFTGASVALRVLVEARRDGLSDEEIVRRAPVVLALVPPRVGPSVDLPDVSSAAGIRGAPPEADAVQVSREALRMRVRWMQELVGQAAYEVGTRLVERGDLDDVDQIGRLTLDDLGAIASWQATVDHEGLVAADRATTRAAVHRPASLPARFQLSDTGHAIAVAERGQSKGGTGAGGGIGRGPVTHDVVAPPEGSVLVVTTLTPQLGPLLPRLAGIVSETGSVLSHLAILAREAGVAVVVGHRSAVDELPDGSLVTVDGTSGRVTKEET